MSKLKKKKVFYFCRRGLGTHLQFYLGWVLMARSKGIPIYLFTTTGFKEYIKRGPLYKNRGIILIPCLKLFDKIVYSFFFIVQIITNQLVIIQLRKRDSVLFEKLKLFFFKKRFKYIVEKEGDIESEYDYLITHPYKKDFYQKIFDNKEKAFKRNMLEILKADHIICVTEQLKNYYGAKYSLDSNKLTSLITGCDSNKFRYLKSIRNKFRKELDLDSKFVLIYIGNVYYSWQNLSKTLEYYQLIKKKTLNIKLILITRLVDKSIVFDFLKKYNIKPSEIILKFSIPNDQIPAYLNAADLGVVLREDHPMNHFAAPGKFGEYACCGLPILTGKGIASFSDKLSKTPYGIVLGNIYDKSEFLIKTLKFMENYKNLDRNEISKWGKLNFSFNAYIDKYTLLLRKLLNEN